MKRLSESWKASVPWVVSSSSSSPQAAAMLVFAFVFAILLAPIGVQAADKLVNIIDDDTGSIAQVDDGSLRVGDGSGSITVDGSVMSAPGPVEEAIQARRGLTGPSDQRTLAGRFAPDASLAITSVIISNPGDVAIETVGLEIVATTSTCSAFTSRVGPVHFYSVPAKDTVQLTFPQPLIVPEIPILPDESWCLQAFRLDPGSQFVDVEVIGYTLLE